MCVKLVDLDELLDYIYIYIYHYKLVDITILKQLILDPESSAAKNHNSASVCMSRLKRARFLSHTNCTKYVSFVYILGYS